MPSPDLFGLSQTGLVSSLLARTGSHVPSLLGLATASTCKIHDLCNLKPDRSFGIAADTQEARWGSSLHELREVRPATLDRRRLRTPAGFHRIACHRRRRRPVHPLIDCQEQLGTALVSRTHWHYGPANAFGELVQLLATARYSQSGSSSPTHQESTHARSESDSQDLAGKPRHEAVVTQGSRRGISTGHRWAQLSAEVNHLCQHPAHISFCLL